MAAHEQKCEHEGSARCVCVADINILLQGDTR